VTPLLGQFAVNAFRLTECQRDFQTFGVHGDMAEGAKSEAENHKSDHGKTCALSAPIRLKQGGCRWESGAG